MGKLSATFGQLRNFLADAGCEIVREGGNHQIWQSADGKHFPVAHHADRQPVPTGTLADCLRIAGLKKEFARYCALPKTHRHKQVHQRDVNEPAP